ncbi:MAG: iron-containing alcohol dehydrogenase family protein [candidate division WOR-3 bacterium]
MYNSIDVPLFITIENDALNNIKKILERANIFINNPVIVTDRGKSYDYALTVGKKLKIKKERFIFVNENTYEEVKRVEKFARGLKSDFIIGIGGGKALDIGKFASFRYGGYFLSIPTLPSHDGIASPVASIMIDGKRMSVGASMPIGIVVDIDVIKNAPKRFIFSGIMDLISNISAINDWELAYRKGYEIKYNGFSKAIAFSAAESVLNYDEKNVYKEEFIKILLNGLVLSGIAMEIAGSSRPASGAEHNFSHAYDLLYPDNTFLHGEKVGAGHLLISFLRDKKEYNKIFSCFNSFGIIEELKNIFNDEEKIFESLKKAKEIRKDRYSFLNEISFDEKVFRNVVKKVKKEIFSF